MDSRCVFSRILAGAAFLTVGLSVVAGGVFREGIEPNVDMSKTYETPVKAYHGSSQGQAVDEPEEEAEADLKKAQDEEDKTAPAAAPGGG